uniref:Angiopoietin-4 n=1 Tax=Magallana gigas TaxID=29159 RepID=K1QG89_MAGGI
MDSDIVPFLSSFEINPSSENNVDAGEDTASTSEKMLTSLLFVGTILCSLDAYEFAIALQKSEYFSDEGDVSYENDNGTLLEVTKSSRMTNSRCAAECLQDLSCNAIELCSTPTAKTCRLSRSWKYTGCTLSRPTCRRFQIVLQRRQDGSEDFYRNWTDYEFGFGSPASEVWLGNKYIHRLTADGHTVLRIELEDHDGNKRYAEYSSFTVADVTDNYRIQVSGYTGDAVRGCLWCGRKREYPQKNHVSKRASAIPYHNHGDRTRVTAVNPKKEPPKKKRRVTEGVLPSLYCPVQTIPIALFTSTLVKQL